MSVSGYWVESINSQEWSEPLWMELSLLLRKEQLWERDGELFDLLLTWPLAHFTNYLHSTKQSDVLVWISHRFLGNLKSSSILWKPSTPLQCKEAGSNDMQCILLLLPQISTLQYTLESSHLTILMSPHKLPQHSLPSLNTCSTQYLSSHIKAHQELPLQVEEKDALLNSSTQPPKVSNSHQRPTTTLQQKTYK